MTSRRGKSGSSEIFFPLGSKITLDGDCSHEIKRHLLLGRKAMTNLDGILKSRDITLLTKVHIVKAKVFQQSCMLWELDHEEGWALKNWCFWTVVLEKTLPSPLDCQEIKPVNPKGNQHWIFIGRTNAEAEAPILWPSDHQKKLWCWERLKAKGEAGSREWDDWIASPPQWTLTGANSGR